MEIFVPSCVRVLRLVLDDGFFEGRDGRLFLITAYSSGEKAY